MANDNIIQVDCHHPHGWCGLKFEEQASAMGMDTSPPTRVVWIEIKNV